MATFNNGESLSSVRTKINDAIDKIDGNATISNDITVGGNIAVTGTVDGRDVAADGTKLDGIEASADVTDTANVTAAGALMDSELTSEASVKALDQGVATTDSPTFAALGVNGTVTADGLTVKTNTLNGEATFYDTNTATVYLQNSVSGTTASDGLSIALSNEIAYINNREAGDMRLYTNNSESMRIASNGDITFFDTSGNASFVYDESAGSVFNEQGDNKDFRVESDGQAHMLFVDASTNRVGINNNVPQAFLHVTSGDATPLGSFRVEQTNVSAGGNSWQSLFEDDSSADQGSGNSIIYINSNRPNTSAGKVLRVVGNSKSSEYFSIYDTGEVVVNESSLSTADFRVESDSYSKMLYVDAAIDAVGIGVGSIPNTDKPSVTIGARTIISQVVTNQTLFSDNAYYSGTQWSTLNTDTWAAIRVNGGSLRFHTGQTSHTAGTNLTAMDTTSMRLLLGDSEAVFNDVSQDTDFRVESDSYTHALYVDAGAGGGTGAVGVGTNNPNRKFVVSEEGVNGIELDPNISGESEIISYNRSTNAYTPLNFAASDIQINASSGAVILNQAGSDVDFRVESDNDTHALFVDASTNRVGVSTSAPPVQFTVGGGDGTAELMLWGNNANSTSSRLIFGGQDPYTLEYMQFRYNSDSNLLQLETDTGFGVGKIVQFDRQYGRVTFNEDSALNADFRVESDASSHAIFSDANQNVVTFFTSELPIMGSSSVQGVSIGNSGNAEMRILNTTTNPNVWLKKQGATGTAINFYKDSSSVGTIVINASSVSYNTTSDYRLKENVVNLTGATERLKQLQPKRFNFISDEDDIVVDGFLAHEAQTVVPEAVTGDHNEVDGDGNPVYQGIDQSKLVPLLVATIKELEARIAALENA